MIIVNVFNHPSKGFRLQVVEGPRSGQCVWLTRQEFQAGLQAEILLEKLNQKN